MKDTFITKSSYVLMAMIHVAVGVAFLITSQNHHNLAKFVGYSNGVVHVLPLSMWGIMSVVVGLGMCVFMWVFRGAMKYWTFAGLFVTIAWTFNYFVVLLHNTHHVLLLATPWLWLWFAFTHAALGFRLANAEDIREWQVDRAEEQA